MLATRVLEDHQKSLKRLFARYRKSRTDGPAVKAGVFAQIKRSLRARLAVEAEMLFPVLCGRPSPNAAASYDGLLQHHFEIEELLVELALRNPRDPSFEEGVSRLEEKVASHLRDVQRGPYREAKRRLSRKRLEELGGEIRARMEVTIRPIFGE